MSEKFQLRESFATDRVEGIDRERGIIYGVKLLGERSRNAPPFDHDYPRSTREAAISLIEGLGVYVNHDTPGNTDTRPYQERMGVIRNVRESGKGLFGDWHFCPDHSLAKQAFWDADNAPQNLGFSINGNGSKSKGKDGRTIVESITDLASIDLVSRPATTYGLRESQRRTVKSTAKQLMEALAGKRPGYVKRLREMVESGVMSDDTAMDAPMDDPAPDEAKDHDQALKDGFRTAWAAIFDDDSMDVKAKLGKAKDLLAALDKLVNGASASSSSSTEPPAETATTESLRLENKALRLLAGKRVEVSPVIEMAIKGCRTEADVTALVESLSPGRPGARSETPGAALSTTRVQESQKNGKTKEPDLSTDEGLAEHVTRLRSVR